MGKLLFMSPFTITPIERLGVSAEMIYRVQNRIDMHIQPQRGLADMDR